MSLDTDPSRPAAPSAPALDDRPTPADRALAAPARLPGVAVPVAILGGGCAGLSLAVRLAALGIEAMVIEPRETYTDDRTWSFWRMRDDPFAACVRRTWARWRVGQGSESVHRASGCLRYESLSAAAFYEHALSRCEGSPVRLALGTRAADPTYRKGRWRIETDRGSLEAMALVDTRPQGTARPGYGQYFTGREVAFDRACLDPEEVGLMQFAAPREGGVDFLYVLPFAPDRALVETTSFTETPPAPGALEGWLDTEIARLAGAGRAETLRSERGFIPMAAPPPFAETPSPGPQAAYAGLIGGAARPSTGYAFARIQLLADRLAGRIAAGREDLALAPDGPATRFMDRLFLKTIRSDPAAAPTYFLSLFRHARRDRLERFLSGSVAAADRLSVAAALPPAPFLRALVRP